MASRQLGSAGGSAESHAWQKIDFLTDGKTEGNKVAKTKTPFLSLGSRGTVGGVLTSQKRGGDTLLRKTPVPTDPYSLAQAYQRWDYKDYAYQWTLLSNAEKQVYRTTGSRYHITGFSQFMREKLKTLPDLALRLRLDEKAGIVAYDTSKHATNGTIFGATPTDGLIAGGQFFTLNDYISVTAPQCDFTSEDFSITLNMRVDDLTIHRMILTRGEYTTEGWTSYVASNGQLIFTTTQTAAAQTSRTAIGFIQTGIDYNIGVSRTGASVRLYAGGIDVTSIVGNHLDPKSCVQPLLVGIYQNLHNYPFDGMLDNLVIYSRHLDATEHYRASQRRYPA
ncbi:hypothetical protein ES708_31412 [subsurface metagenome]